MKDDEEGKRRYEDEEDEELIGSARLHQEANEMRVRA